LRVLATHWDDLNGGDDIVSIGDLRSEARNSSNSFELRVAARHYEAYPEHFDALETAWNGVQDDKASNLDLRVRMDAINSSPPVIQQVSTHNAYDHDDSLTEQFAEHGITSFELDIHDNDDGLLGEQVWDVRHFGHNDSTGRFDDFLSEINALDTDDPVTVFVDIKSSLGSDGPSPTDLDEVLQTQFGDRLFTPADQMARTPNAPNLQASLQQTGWPSEEELNGRVIVVLTGNDKLDAYLNERPDGAPMSAFIAPAPVVENGEFVPSADAIFYNLNASDGRDNTASLNQQITDNGNLVRNYNVGEGNFDQLAASGANFLATDDYAELSDLQNPPAEVLLATGNYEQHFTRGTDLDLSQTEADTNEFNGGDNHVVVQSIFDPVVANKPTTIDEYSVIVNLPDDVDPQDIFISLAADMDGELGGEFAELGDFKNQGTEPQVGQVIDIDVQDGGVVIPFVGWRVGESPFNAPVVISSIDDNSFTVQTIEYNNSEHVLHGTREWGFEPLPDGSFRFYTRGVSVEDIQAAEGFPVVGGAKEGEFRFWSAWVDGVERLVTSDAIGGEVVDGSQVIEQTQGPSGRALWDRLTPNQQDSISTSQIESHQREADQLIAARDELVNNITDIDHIDRLNGYDDLVRVLENGDAEEGARAIRDFYLSNTAWPDGPELRAAQEVGRFDEEIGTLNNLANEHRSEIDGWQAFLQE